MTEIFFEYLGLILFTSIFLSMLLVPATSRLAHKVGAIDIPRSRSSHATPTPRMGGLAISLSLAMACLAYLPLDSFLRAFLSGLVVVVAIGVIDDVFEVSPRWKFVGQIVAATLFVYLSGLKIEHIGDIVGLGNIELGGASFAFTVFCIVGGMNAFNLSDGLDGLAGGLAVIAAVFFGYFAWRVQDGVLLIITVSLLGAIIGFLRYNVYPAKVFMGDSGSLMLGYVLAVLLVALSRSAPVLPVASLAMVVALPLLDTLLVMARRVRYGHSPFLPDRTHLHHRLMSLGLPHPVVVVVVYCVMLCFGLLAIVLKQKSDWVIFSSLAGFGLLVFASVSGLQHAGFCYENKGQAKNNSIRQSASFKRVADWLRRSAKPIGIGILVVLLIPAIFAPLMPLSSNKALTLYLVSGLLIFFCWHSDASNKSILHGALYLAIFALLLIYEVSSSYISSWVEGYISAASIFVLLWVTLKLFFSKHNEIVFASGFELLMLFVSWFVPFVVLEELNISASTVHAVQHACLLSIPFLLAMKINIRVHGGHNRWITILLVFGLAVVGVRGVL